MRQAQFLPSPTVSLFADVEHGLEWIEDTLLQSMAGRAHGLLTPVATAKTDLHSILAADFTADALERLMGFCEELVLPEQTPLFRTGEAGDALYFILYGEVSALTRRPDGQTIRVRTMGPGAACGGVGSLLSPTPFSRCGDGYGAVTCANSAWRISCGWRASALTWRDSSTTLWSSSSPPGWRRRARRSRPYYSGSSNPLRPPPHFLLVLDKCCRAPVLLRVKFRFSLSIPLPKYVSLKGLRS